MTSEGENGSARWEFCASATFAATNPTWAAMGLNPRLHSEKSRANRCLLNALDVCF
jgi:hypothetical protein